LRLGPTTTPTAQSICCSLHLQITAYEGFLASVAKPSFFLMIAAVAIAAGAVIKQFHGNGAPSVSASLEAISMMSFFKIASAKLS
jgi:hypothetical protein